MGIIDNGIKGIKKIGEVVAWPVTFVMRELGKTRFGRKLVNKALIRHITRHELVIDPGTGTPEEEFIPGTFKKRFKVKDKTGKSLTNAKILQVVIAIIIELAIAAGIATPIIINQLSSSTSTVDSLLANCPEEVQEIIEKYPELAAIYESIYGDDALFDVVDDSIQESADFSLYLAGINFVGLQQNEDNSGVLTLNIRGTYDKRGDLEPHTYDLRFNLTKEEYNKIAEAYNVKSLNEQFLKLENEDCDTLDMLNKVDLVALKTAIDTISSTIKGKNCTVVEKNEYEITLPMSEEKGSLISPVVDKYYYEVFEGNPTDFAENYTEELKEFFWASHPISGNSVSHYYTYELSEDGTSISATVTAEVEGQQTLSCDIIITNMPVLFNNETISTIISNYFSGVEQDAVVTLKNKLIPTANFVLADNPYQVIWDYVNDFAEYGENKTEFYDMVGEANELAFTYDSQGNIVSYSAIQDEKDNELTTDPDEEVKDDKAEENVDKTVNSETKDDTELVEDEEITSGVSAE